MRNTQPIPTINLRVIKAIRQNNRRRQCPSKNPVADPRTDDLDPAGPVGSPDGDEVAVLPRLVAADALGQERCYPCGGEHEDDVEERVVVLRPGFLVVVFVGWGVVIVIVVAVVESGCGESARFDCPSQRFLTHLATTLRLLVYETVRAVFCVELSVA